MTAVTAGRRSRKGAAAKARPVGARAMLAPHQIAILDDQSPVVVIRGSRRGGKDAAVAAKIVIERITGRKNDDCTYSTLREENAREFIAEAQKWCRLAGHMAEIVEGPEMFPRGAIQTQRITLPHVRGRTPVVRVVSSDPDASRGLDGTQILSEFAFRDHPWETYDAAAPCIALGGQVIILSSVNVEGDPFEEACDMGRRRAAGTPLVNDLPVSLHEFDVHTVAGNGFLDIINRVRGTALTPEGFVAQCRAMARNQETWEREFLLIPSREVNSYFPYALQAEMPPSAVAPVHSFGTFMAQVRSRTATLAADCLFAGCDVGRRRDSFVLLVRARVGGMRRLVGILELGRMVPDSERSFGAMQAAIDTLMESWFETAANDGDRAVQVRRLCIDESGLGLQLAEQRREKFRTRIDPIKFVLSNKEDMATTLRADAEQKLIDMSTDARVRGQWNAIRCVRIGGGVRFDGDRNADDGHQDVFWADALCSLAAKTGQHVSRAVALEGYCA